MKTRFTELSKSFFQADDLNTQIGCIDQMYQLYSALSGLNADTVDLIRSDPAYLPDGEALSPPLAASCMFDYLRTVKFMRAVFAAAGDLLKRNEKINILYAGCGPFAPLVMPLTSVFTPQQIAITAVDVHPAAINALKKIVAGIGAEDFFDGFMAKDISTLDKGDVNPPHLIICETMQQALMREPQVANMLHLAPMLAKEGVFIPEQLCLEAAVMTAEPESVTNTPGMEAAATFRQMTESKRLAFKLDAAAINTACPAPEKEGGVRFLRGEAFELPAVKADHGCLSALTTVKVYKNIALLPGESVITFPKTLFRVEKEKALKCRMRYLLGRWPHPEFMQAD